MNLKSNEVQSKGELDFSIIKNPDMSLIKEEMKKTWELFDLDYRQVVKDYWSFGIFQNFEKFWEVAGTQKGLKSQYQFNFNSPKFGEDKITNRFATSEEDKKCEVKGNIQILRYLFIDVDTENHKEGGSDEEVLEIYKKARKIVSFLKNEGFPLPIFSTSGGGIHLHYQLNIPATKENKLLVEDFIKSLAKIYPEVDTSVINPGRLSRLYDSVNIKGNRLSRIIWKEQEVQTLNEETLSLFLEKYPAPKKREFVEGESDFNISKNSNFDWEFKNAFMARFHSLKNFLTIYKIEHYAEPTIENTNWKYRIPCVFYKDGEGHDDDYSLQQTCLFENLNGTIYYFCWHIKCKERVEGEYLQPTFKEFVKQVMGEEDFNSTFYPQQALHQEKAITSEVKSEVKQRWSIMNALEGGEKQCFPTTYTALDEALGGGLFAGEVSILVADTGQGKTSMVNNLALRYISQNKVMLYSGEMSAIDIAESIVRINYAVPDEQALAIEDIASEIEKIEDKLFLFTKKREQEGEEEWQSIIDDIDELTSEDERVKLVFVDNISWLVDYTGDNLREQKQFMKACIDLAKKKNIHILLVAHPNKNSLETKNKININGSAIFSKLAAVVMEIERNKKTNLTTLNIQKNRKTGKNASISFTYENKVFEEVVAKKKGAN